MRKTQRCCYLASLIPVLFSHFVTAEMIDGVDVSGWLDPINRDESIDQTTVSTTTSLAANGLYEYRYQIVSSEENKGRISGFIIDLACDLDFGHVPLPPWENEIIERNGSEDGLHVPVRLFSALGSVSMLGISSSNEGHWMMDLQPGQTTAEFWLVSPAPPGLRTYSMDPSMDTWGWRYDLYEGDPNIKWIEDFRVTGEIIGPACQLAEPQEPPGIAFLGVPSEPFNHNQLLAYSSPTAGDLLLESNTASITVFYHDSIDPDSFKARLNGKDVSSLFTPIQGEQETVIVPVAGKQTKRKLHLSVLGVTTGEKNKGNARFKSIDNDWFTFK